MINHVRRSNLTALIEERFEGNRAAFSRAVGKNPNLVNLILSKNPEYQRNIGEKLARDVEKQLSLPNGWLDQMSPTNNVRSVSIPIMRTIESEAEEWLVLLPDHARKLYPVGNLNNAVFMQVGTDHMSPHLNQGDMVMIDTSKNTVEPSGKIYAVEQSGTTIFARFRQNMSGDISICFDNSTYPSEPLTAKLLPRLKVLGAAVTASKFTVL